MLEPEQISEIKEKTKAALKDNLSDILKAQGLSPQEIEIAIQEKEDIGYFDGMAENAFKSAVKKQVKAGVESAFKKFREQKLQEAKPEQLRTAGTHLWHVWALALLGPLGSGITALIMRSWLIGTLTLASLVVIGASADSLEQKQKETIPLAFSLGIAGIASSQIRKTRRTIGDPDGSKARTRYSMSFQNHTNKI